MIDVGVAFRHVVGALDAAGSGYLVVAKLRWRLTTRSEVQWRDCVEIAATHELDRDHLRAWADRLGTAADLAELLDDS